MNHVLDSSLPPSCRLEIPRRGACTSADSQILSHRARIET